MSSLEIWLLRFKNRCFNSYIYAPRQFLSNICWKIYYFISSLSPILSFLLWLLCVCGGIFTQKGHMSTKSFELLHTQICSQPPGVRMTVNPYLSIISRCYSNARGIFFPLQIVIISSYVTLGTQWGLLCVETQVFFSIGTLNITSLLSVFFFFFSF